MSAAEWGIILTAITGLIATIVKNSRDIALLKRYACFRNPCSDRLSRDALGSKSRPPGP